MSLRDARVALPVLGLAVAGFAACAPVDDNTNPNSAHSLSSNPSDSASGGACAKENLSLLTPGKLTVGTDSPAYPPWFVGNDPTNDKGYESAVAYAVADDLGFSADEVTWVKVPFNTSYKPGDKNFDFDINQISITPDRAQVVDFSTGYYDAAQAVVALNGTPIAQATSVAQLADYNLGAQTGTTSLTAIRDVIKPAHEPSVFEDTNAAKQALLNHQVDGILTDLPTAFYISAVEIKNSTIVGQFQPEGAQPEQFGMLFAKGSTLVPCVNTALADLKQSGKLDALEKKWLSDVVDVPVLQ